MAEGKLKIEIYRNKNVNELTQSIANPEEKCDTGSAAASTGAIAAALLHRASALCLQEGQDNERLQWLERNSEILRSYMVKLIDEDIKCRAPLRRALKENDTLRIEASRQVAVSICAEIINMMGKCLEMLEELLPFAKLQARAYLCESAELAWSTTRIAVPYILEIGSYSSDETYRFVLKRENELTMEEQSRVLKRIRETYPI